MARYALVIGIAQYPNSGLKPLPKAVTDAEVVAQVLEQYGDYKVIRLPGRRDADKNSFKMVDKAVNGAEVGQALTSLLQERAGNSEVLIYYAGHGFTISDNLGRQKGFLATSDCQIEKVGNVAIEQKYGISLESLNELIQESDLSSLVLLLDCCHSGYFLESQLVQQTLTAFSSQKNYYLITACRSFENAKSFKGEPHAIFTGALLKGLSAENAGSKGRISGARLFDFISEELKNSAEQEPICLGWGRSITLVTYPQQEISPELLPSSLAIHRENPYLGLRAFEDTEGDYFFGREVPVRVLLDRLKNGRFIAIIGPSGCGKSSLVKAGLLRKLKQNCLPGSSHWIVQSFTPGIHPLQELEKALREQQQDKQLLLFIDQFEELFTLCEDEEERKIFINRVTAEATNADRMTRIIVAMRGDFLDRCAAYQEIAILINRAQPTTFMVTQLTPAELEEAIEKPAEKQGVKFEWGLVGQIIADVINQPGALPLLQYALAELWRVCITGSTSPQPQLTHKCYEEIRGVRGALEKRANELYHNLAPADKYFVRRLFLELVQLGEGKEVTRRRATWQDLATIADSQEQLQRVTRQLASQQERLIITDEKTVEVAHEALLSEWKLLQGWIEQDWENLRLSRRLKSECQEWEKNAGSDGLLLTDAWLAAITDWVEKTQPRLSVVEREFLQKSLDKREQEIQKQLANERELRELAEARQKEAEDRALLEIEKAVEAEARAKAEAKEEIAKAKAAQAVAKIHKQRTRFSVAIGLLLSFSLGLGILVQQLEGQKKQREAMALGISITRAQQLFDMKSELEAIIASLPALNYMIKIRNKDSKILAQLQAIILGVKERNRLEGHTRSVNSVSFSPTDPLIASASSDETVKLWQPDGRLISTAKLMKHDGEVWTVTFSPNGKYIASGGSDKFIKVWRKDGTLMFTLIGHEDEVNYVSFSPDSQMIVSASSDRKVKVWKIPENSPKVVLSPIKTFTGHAEVVRSANFSPDGNLIVSSSDDDTIRLWDVADGSSLKILTGHTAAVMDARFARDNQTIISVSNDRSIKIWSGNSNLKSFNVKTLKLHTNAASIVRFSPDYKLIAATSNDGTVQLWRTQDGTLLPSLGKHADTVYDLSFRPDSQEIITASRDKTLRIWSLETNNRNLSKVSTETLLEQGCDWLSDYFNNNLNVQTTYPDIQRLCN